MLNSPILFYLVANFYAINLLKGLMILSPLIDAKSYQKLWQDLVEYEERYNKQLALMFYEHTVLAVQCELRHCKKMSEYFIPNFFGDGWYKNFNDKRCYACHEFEPKSILKAGSWLFNEDNNYWFVNSWGECNYGGDMWEIISSGGLKYVQMPDSVFIDHMVDLQHNNALFMLKETGEFTYTARLGPATYEKLLDDKKNYGVSAFVYEYAPYLCYDVLSLIERYQYITKETMIDPMKLLTYKVNRDRLCESSVELLFNHKPIKWGNKSIDLNSIQATGNDFSDYEDDEEIPLF